MLSFYLSSLDMLMMHTIISLQEATHRQFSILALSLPLPSLRVRIVLSTLTTLKEIFLRPVVWRKDLEITSLRFYRKIARTKDFRKGYLEQHKVVEKNSCLRPVSKIFHNSNGFKENDIFLQWRLRNELGPSECQNRASSSIHVAEQWQRLLRNQWR